MRIHKIFSSAIVTLIISATSISAVFAESFKFVALGDMPYSQPADFPRFERLIKSINSQKPAFSIFVGDTKSGGSQCSNEHVQKMTDYFNSFKAPLIYSIGDNEWTDCHRLSAGQYNPIERLEHIRNHQFKDAKSFGEAKIQLERQAERMPQFSLFVENSLWTKGNFLFISLHIPGSNNNLGRNDESDREYQKRNEANLAWINHAFNLAKEKKYNGLVFAFQADLFHSPEMATSSSSGYKDTISAFRNHAENLMIPILLIHGDSHQLKIDQPLKSSKNQLLEHVYRLEVMGANQVQAVEVSINSKESSPFNFRPLVVPENFVVQKTSAN
jgi:hypothetical protein